MQLGIDSQIPDGLLAANALLAENSRQGVPTSTHTLHRGFEFAISSTVLGFQFRCYESASDPVVAPNNGTPWYKNPCVQSAVAKGAASTAIDAVGLLPEGGAVAGAFSLWHRAAGVSNGINILSRVQFGAAIISTASAGSDASQDSALSLAGAQLATGFASIGVGLAKAAPIVGQALSAASVLEDLYGTYQAVAGCHP